MPETPPQPVPMTPLELARARQRQRFKELQEQLRNAPEAQAIAALWSLPAFQVLLGHLREKFYDCDLLGDSDAETYLKLGEREVVRVLQELRKRTERTGT